MHKHIHTITHTDTNTHTYTYTHNTHTNVKNNVKFYHLKNCLGGLDMKQRSFGISLDEVILFFSNISIKKLTYNNSFTLGRKSLSILSRRNLFYQITYICKDYVRNVCPDLLFLY